MDRNQTGNILIGAGVLAGLGTLAYWLMSGGTFGESAGASGPALTQPTAPSIRPGLITATSLPAITSPVNRPTAVRPSVSPGRTF